MKSLTIIGAGMGCGTMTVDGLNALKMADGVFGAERLLKLADTGDTPVFKEYSADKISRLMESEKIDNAVLLVSGDTGFYSAASSAAEMLPGYDIRFIPGISSMNYFFARLKKSWQNAALVSCHGRNANFADTVRRNKVTFALTGGNCAELSSQLENADLGDVQLYVGKNLGAENEQVYLSSVSQLSNEHDSLTVLAVENPNASAAVPFGIADDCFCRGQVPMTKAEVRAVTMSKLSIAPESICIDIGCGTGSVTVEMALAAYKGHVYSVDKSEEAVALTRENCRSFHIGNVDIRCGDALEELKKMPKADVVFIGGSGGEMVGLVSEAVNKNPQVKIAANAIALESVMSAKKAFESCGIKPEIVQLSISRAKTVGSLSMMTGQNPIFVIYGGKSDE